MDSENKYNNCIKRVKVPYLSEYYTIEDVDELLVGKQDTLITGENIDITNNTISAKGYKFNSDTNGGFAEKYKQDVADGGQVVNNTATGLGSHAEGYSTTASGEYGCHAEGNLTEASGYVTHAEGNSTKASETASHAEGGETEAKANYAHAEGYQTKAIGRQSHAEGGYTKAKGLRAHAEGEGASADNLCAIGNNSHTEGLFTQAQNYAEHAQGAANISHKTASNAATDWQGDGNHTLHSIGNGRYTNLQSNAVEVMQNADVYIKGIGNYDGVHIKGESGAPSGLQTLQEVVSGKQDNLVAGNNIEISGNTISAIVPSIDVIDDTTTETGKTWSSDKINSELSNKQDVLTAGDNIEISGDTINCTIPPTLVDSTVSLFTALWKGTQEEYDNLSEHDPKTMYIISDE